MTWKPSSQSMPVGRRNSGLWCCCSRSGPWAAPAGTPFRRRGSGAVTIKPLPGAAASFLRLPVRLSRGLAGFSEPARARRLGILRAYPSVLAELPQVSARMDGAGGRWPGAADLARTLFTAPTHSRLSTSEYQEMVGLLLGYRG